MQEAMKRRVSTVTSGYQHDLEPWESECSFGKRNCKGGRCWLILFWCSLFSHVQVNHALKYLKGAAVEVRMNSIVPSREGRSPRNPNEAPNKLWFILLHVMPLYRIAEANLRYLLLRGCGVERTNHEHLFLYLLVFGFCHSSPYLI